MLQEDKSALLTPLLKRLGTLPGRRWSIPKAQGLPPLTKIRIASLAELPAAPKAEIKGLFIRLPQLVATLDGCKCLLGIAVSDEAIVVTRRQGETEAEMAIWAHAMDKRQLPRVQGLERSFSFPKWPTL